LRLLMLLGVLSLVPYLAALVHGRFRPGRMEPFFPIFFGAFALYMVASWIVLRYELPRRSLVVIFGVGLLINAILIPTWPTLSDDMFRYVWDGRVQANGINPYRYASNAPALEKLRDPYIWKGMNRIDANTIYPPGAQMFFALTWRVVGDSVAGFKIALLIAVFAGGLLLVWLLEALGERPERVLIYLWSPLLAFEVAHAGHVDALYLPFIIGAFLVRVRAPHDRVSSRAEALIGVLLGIATLFKLWPAILAAPLWSLRDAAGRRRWRWAFPLAMVATIAAGYAVYYAPGINMLGYLAKYQREHFNIGTLPYSLIEFAFVLQRQGVRVAWYTPNSVAMPALIIVISLVLWAFPARTVRGTIWRCYLPIAAYLLVNQNLFSWYALWLLPLVALDLRAGRIFGFGVNMALAWWIFTGLLAISYLWFIGSSFPEWARVLEFFPLYILLIASAGNALLQSLQKR
jgi:hypothetical protein